MIEHRTESFDGTDVDLVTIHNGPWKAVVTNLGARLTELHVPGRNGETADVVLQRPTLKEMAHDDNYFGATAGRYANRIRNGRFTLDGAEVRLGINEGQNHLHGGITGFDRFRWQTHVDHQMDSVRFSRISPDGEEGFPGNLDTRVTYTLAPPALLIEIRATADASTIANIVNHAYFNLGGHDSGTVLDHVVRMRSSFYTPVDDELLATGEVRTVEATPFDFRTATPIGARLDQIHNGAAGRQTDRSAGYDHNFVLDGTGMREVFEATDPASGRRLILSTDQPGLQFYTGGYLHGVTAKPPLEAYPAHAGFTLETQTFPDSPNFAHFPSPRLDPGQTYQNSIRLEFATV
ncbi:aldose epimerase family protein [Amycolatopsis pithecellobii]|uniref:Aldose 1-epimerase n=1 Tax=Amycolatopsis pithecellobii TaxID=664692 RepID=A0A6N7Z9W4_9PSEU|nr:aldose epimerase family protein [Amycolatopsis pithecellobii]MTD58522.1 galactose-1-epimerase [Amycolatopsis pithecellobii]